MTKIMKEGFIDFAIVYNENENYGKNFKKGLF